MKPDFDKDDGLAIYLTKRMWRHAIFVIAAFLLIVAVILPIVLGAID